MNCKDGRFKFVTKFLAARNTLIKDFAYHSINVYREYDISRYTTLQLQRDWSHHSIHRRVNRREFFPSLKSKIFEIKTFALHMTLDDGRRGVNEKGVWGWRTRGRVTASYARKQEDVTVKNPGRGTKNVSERESGVCMCLCVCVCVSPPVLPRARGARHCPTYGPLFQPSCVSAFPHGQDTAIRVCVCVRTHDDARTDASIKLFEFSIEQKGKFALTRITLSTSLFLLIRNLCIISPKI